MQYKEFNDILVNNWPGVSRVGPDTLRMAHHAGRQAGRTALDMGSGTGFIALYLRSRGWRCMGVDVNGTALQCADRNARANNMQLKFKYSDLFSDVSGLFDLIVFNPPLGHTSAPAAPLEFVKSLMPRNNRVVIAIAYFFVGKQRRELLRRFLEQVPRHLEQGGVVMMSLYRAEMSLTGSWKTEVLEEVNGLRVVSLQRLD